MALQNNMPVSRWCFLKFITPWNQRFYENLVSRGKPKKAAVVASMRKLIHIIYGVLKNKTPFDQNWESERVFASNQAV